MGKGPRGWTRVFMCKDLEYSSATESKDETDSDCILV